MPGSAREDDRSLVLVANAVDGSISVFRFSGGLLTRVFVAEDLPGCSNFVIDTDRDLVHASVKGDPAGIITLTLDKESGALTPVSRLDLPRGGMNYLALTHDRRALLGASYGGGYGIISPVRDGVVEEPTSVVEYPNLHSVLPSADSRFAYFVSLGADLVAQFAIADDISLVALDPAVVHAPEGSGPRHLVFNEAEDAIYVLTEFTGEVLHLRRDTATGALELVGSSTAFDTSRGLVQGTLGANPIEDRAIWAADLHFGGDHLWASERSESTLGAVRVGDGGATTAPERFITTELRPRGFAISADGRFLVAAGEGSRTVSLYTVDGDRLDLLQQAETGAGANWVRFV